MNYSEKPELLQVFVCVCVFSEQWTLMKEYNLIKENNEIKQQDPDAEHLFKNLKFLKSLK